MKRMICLILALFVCLSLVPAVRADVIFEPEDSFYWEYRGECVHHERAYTANGPDNVATVYVSPKSGSVVKRVKNGLELWISYVYEDDNGISWGYTENYYEDWTGWVPMDYLLLIYDCISFQEEFAHRITEGSGSLAATQEPVRFWTYPGSQRKEASMVLEGDYLPEYQQVFTDDAGREWGFVSYYMGVRQTWICLDDPTADYDTLYAELPPQQVTHPTAPDTVPAQIRPAGPGLGGIITAVCIISVLSMCFLLMTRKKK